MELSLTGHVFIHIFLAFLSGFIVWKIWGEPMLSFGSAFVSGVLVDFDHFIDYFIAFGWEFNLFYFFNGYSFLKTNKMYTLFHGWEYAIFCLLAVFLFEKKRTKVVFLALFLGLIFHLNTDVVVDKIPFESYSIAYKIKRNFLVKNLVYPEHWEKHKDKRIEVRIE